MYRSAQRRSSTPRGRNQRTVSGRNKRIIAVLGTVTVFAGIVAVTQVSSANDQLRTASECVAPSPGSTAEGGVTTTVTQENGREVRHHWGDGQITLEECESGTTLVAAPTIECPSVVDSLPEVPAAARTEVERNLGLLENQIEEANNRLASSVGEGGPNFINNAILGPLASKRAATLDRIEIAIGRVAPRPRGLDELATCELVNRPDNNDGNDNDGNDNDGNDNDGNDNDGGGDEGNNNDGNDNDGNNDGDNGLEILANSCDDSNLDDHDGFQVGNRCIDTQFGEVGAAANNPSLLITEFPDEVGVDEPFTIRVSTRNLVRDRFLPAAQGGYYVESSLLDEQGLTRGHFHTACRMLQSTEVAPDPAPAPEFFVATEDGGGGREPDQITIQVSGMPQSGTAQCSVWAGDGSHRLPMSERANQTPAFDSVRIEVN
ncbi:MULTISPECIES: hypothetical protein [unclassified Solwaraspora]|uniref:hypothetical protein n=1 Tax=unclassified Solwaraspora TaxID=2627926 RepID=UPI00248D1A68|nr:MULTISPECIES: hypothetical protein [unclassified Solwaraspora]WBB95310.1 hypothetical protein O7553_18115 [Solwaraspora sp. WMMA2059]WBC20785.1 hypothetical protein O7543_29245 [Solwaraspora sp. WMMA2080]WJK37081.1 hypothetical protein O7610_12430 [Solwaraspora sp. WMMA2065]